LVAAATALLVVGCGGGGMSVRGTETPAPGAADLAETANTIGEAFRAGNVDALRAHVSRPVTTRYTEGNCDPVSDGNCVEEATAGCAEQLGAWLEEALARSESGPLVGADPTCADACCTFDPGHDVPHGWLTLDKLCLEWTDGGFQLMSIEVTAQ